jgi:hypothetical protein
LTKNKTPVASTAMVFYTFDTAFNFRCSKLIFMRLLILLLGITVLSCGQIDTKQDEIKPKENELKENEPEHIDTEFIRDPIRKPIDGGDNEPLEYSSDSVTHPVRNIRRRDTSGGKPVLSRPT